MNKVFLKYTYLGSFLSGILLGLSYLSFSAYHQGILAYIAFVPYLLSIREDVNFKKYLPKILITYTLTILIGFWWTGYYKPIAVLVCLLTQILFFNLSFIIHFFFQKRFGWQKALILLPFQWTIIEWITQKLPHNLQVLHLAYTQANMIYTNQIADFSGMWGLSFWVVTINVLIALSFTKPHPNPSPNKEGRYPSVNKLTLFGLGGVVLIALFYSIWKVELSPKSVIGSSAQKAKVSLIQTNIDSYQPIDSTVLNNTFNQIVSLSDSAVRKHRPDLLVLPEATFPFALFQDSPLFRFTRSAVANWQTSLAIGYSESLDSTRIKYQNKSLVFTPQLAVYWDSLKITPDQVKVYEKEFGLPFMEMMPYCADCKSFQDRILVGGDEPYTFSHTNQKGDILKVALTICWEQTHPNKIISLVNDGATYIALMNNDSWFGKTPAARYLQNMTKLRAIENRRAIARCSNGGISCFIDPFGRVYGEIPWFTAKSSTQEVACVSKKSFYTQNPNLFAYLLGIILFIFIIFFEFRKPKITSKEVLN